MSNKYPTFSDNDSFYAWRIQYLEPYTRWADDLSQPLEPDDHIINQVGRFIYDPLAAALYLWSWGEDDLENCRLQNWQIEAWARKRDHLQNHETRFDPFKLAICSGHGIGKTAFMAQDTIIELATLPFARGLTTANTGTQLATKTWAELKKWLEFSIVEHWFEYTATKLQAREIEDQKRWCWDAINWSKANPAAFAGAHNQGRRIGLKFDEASEIPGVIFEVGEGAMSDLNTHLSWFVFGNGTQNSGQFYDIFMSNYGNDWIKMQVDSRSTSLTNPKTLQKQIDQHGLDSDFVIVRILGGFPKNAVNQAIPTENILAASERVIKHDSVFNWAPVVVGIDPSGNGGDELTAWLRQGCFCKEILRMPKNNDDMLTARTIIQQCALQHPYPVDAYFIDLGYGSGIYSFIKNHTEIPVHLISFASASPDPAYYNIRAFMWLRMSEWLKDEGVLSPHDKIQRELAGPRLYMSGGKMAGRYLIESKDDMADRDVPSPNHADALGLTFVAPVKKLKRLGNKGSGQKRRQVIRSSDFEGMN